MADAGQSADGCKLMEDGLLALKTIRSGQYRPLFLTWLASFYCRFHQKARGLTLLDEARSFMDSGGELWAEPEFYVVKSQLLMLTGDSGRNCAEAEACAKKALDIARAQKSVSQEVRSATNLARIWRDAGKMREAEALVNQVCASIPEEINSRDLQEARAVLEELGHALRTGSELERAKR